MARNRVIYQSEALYVGPDATSGHYAVPLTVAVKRDGATSAAGVVNLTTSKRDATSHMGVAATAVTMSGIYPLSLPSIPTCELLAGGHNNLKV